MRALRHRDPSTAPGSSLTAHNCIYAIPSGSAPHDSHRGACSTRNTHEDTENKENTENTEDTEDANDAAEASAAPGSATARTPAASRPRRSAPHRENHQKRLRWGPQHLRRAARRQRGRSAPPYDHDVVTHDVVATDLTPQQQLELQFKASSSSDLIDDGLRTVRDGRLSTANRDQVLASLATGLDRLYTLALDLHRLELGRLPERPDAATLPEPSLADLHARLFDILGLHPGRTSGGADQWLCRLSADPVADALVEALGYYRDTTASEQRAPDSAWERVRAAVDLDPGVGSHRLRSRADDGAGGTDDAADPAGAENPGDAAAGTATARAYREAWNSRFISTVETIRSTIDACSQDGLLGGPAQSLGAELAQRRRGTDAA